MRLFKYGFDFSNAVDKEVCFLAFNAVYIQTAFSLVGLDELGGMHHSLTSAIWNTFAIAMLAATASTALGSIAAIGIFNLRTRTRGQVVTFLYRAQ